MKKKKKILIGMGACILAIGVALTFVLKKEDDNKNVKKSSFDDAKKAFQDDVQALKDGKYDNLKSKDFTTSIDDVEGLYNLEIEVDRAYVNKSHLENLESAEAAINKFFNEDVDKSFLEVDFSLTPGEEPVTISYDDVKTECVKDEYKNASMGFIFGSDKLNGGYFIQTTASLVNSWFSRYELKDSGPFETNCKDSIAYVSCIRQEGDMELNLLDGKIKLSEMENKVLTYVNEDFPLYTSEGISYGIAQAYVVPNGEYEGISFKLRRIYKGVTFEHGSAGGSVEYLTYIKHDSATIAYASSMYPDTLMGFGATNVTVVEKDSITEMISLGEALDLLSEQIGSNSVYDVYGVELTYRNCEIPEDKVDISDILKPVWKVITMNQNDDKYTLFYIDVVTGEITERFEYYYE